MRFAIKTLIGKEQLRIASSEVEQLLQHGSIMDEHLSLKNDWKYDNIANGKEVFLNLMKVRPSISVYFYKPFNPWSAAVAYFDGSAIHFNSRKFGALSLMDVKSTLLHEYAHYCGYTHGNNYKTKDKCLYSVPYYLSENVAKWL